MNLNKNNLKLKIDELEGIIGNTFIHDLTTQYEKICLKSIPNWLKDLEYENMHPFIHWWLSLQYCLKETNKELQLKLNDESIRALELLDNLNVIKKRNSIDRLISALQKKAKFFSTVFETRIAAEYITAGNRIQIMDENGRDGKQFDFLMTNNFVKYAVECKSMENDFDKKKCQKLIETLVKRISNEKRIHIHYEIEDILTSSMYNRIIQETIDNIKKENLEYPNLEQRKGYKIFQYKIIENVNEYRFEKKPELVTFKIDINPVNKDIDNILVLSLSRTIQNSFPKKSENFIRKAKKQLPKNMPTVVHLELPYENNSKFADYTDSSYDMIFNYINRNTRRINAVIISSMILDLNNFPYIQYIPLIVPSYNSYHQFPSTYDLVGVKNKKIPINLKEFVIDCNFKTPNTITETIQSILLNHSSNDGKEQLKIWYISRKKVRIELVNQFHKRDYIDIKCEIIPAMSYRFIFECSTNRFRVFLFQSDYKGSLKDKCYLKEI